MCAKITDDVARDDCYYSLAYYRKDNSICGNIELQSTKDWCYGQVQ